MGNEKDSEKIPPLVNEDPAQTRPPTQIILEQEPIPNPDLPPANKPEKKK